MPVIRKAHQPQFPETPFCLTKSVTRFGVSVENVVATILIPSNHHGIFRPARKKDFISSPAFLEALIPTPNEIRKKAPIIDQSR